MKKKPNPKYVNAENSYAAEWLFLLSNWLLVVVDAVVVVVVVVVGVVIFGVVVFLDLGFLGIRDRVNGRIYDGRFVVVLVLWWICGTLYIDGFGVVVFLLGCVNSKMVVGSSVVVLGFVTEN